MSDKKIEQISLHDITSSHNPRCPARNLVRNLIGEGYEGWSIQDLIHNLALSEDAEKRAEYVRLLEKYEWKIERHEKAVVDAESIVELAASISERQIEPIMLRRFTILVEGQHVDRYGVIVGERRMMAAAYNYAKHGLPARIMATIVRMSVAESTKWGWEENRRRKPPTDLEIALYFHQQWKEKKGTPNPDTGRNWSMKDVAAAMDEDYQTFRRYESLAYLPEADQRRLDVGQIGLVAAVNKAMDLKRGRSNGEAVRDKKSNRRRVMTLKQVEDLFDTTTRNKTTFLEALATVMGITVDVAIKESDVRIAEKERK